MVFADQKNRTAQKIRRKWSFTGNRFSFPRVTMQALLTIALLLILFLFLFRPQVPEKFLQTGRTSGVYRLTAQHPALRRQLDLRDPAAGVAPEAPAGYLALRPRREEDFFITRPEMRDQISPRPALSRFVPLPEREIRSVFLPGNIPGPAVFSPPETTGGQLFSEEGNFLAALPLPPSETAGKAGETILKISGTGPLRTAILLVSCGNSVRDRSAVAFLESRRDPDGLYLVTWPENSKKGEGQ